MTFRPVFAQESFGPQSGVPDAAAKGAAIGFTITILIFVLLSVASTIYYFVCLRQPRSRSAGKSLKEKEREALEEMSGMTKKRKKAK